MDDSDVPPPCSCHSLPKGSCPRYIDKLINDIATIRRSGVPNMDGKKIPVDSELVPEAWDKMLVRYFDHDEILSGVKYGWDLSFPSEPLPKDATRNHPSALKHEGDIDKYVEKELQFGALVGPLPDNLPFPTFCSPFGSVPKPKTNSTRTITDCSQHSAGINNWIDPHFHRGREWHMHLPTGQNIVQDISRVRRENPGKKILLFKIDMSRYYRFFVLCPGQSVFFCVQWRGRRYLDRACSFGNRGACLCSQRASNAIAWIFRTQVEPRPGVPNSGRFCCCRDDCDCGDLVCRPYVDDLSVAAPEDVAHYLFGMLLAIIKTLGLQASKTPGNIVPPTEIAVVLGVQYNLVDNTVSLPPEKLADTISLLFIWLGKDTATKRELKSIIGKLLYCSRVVAPGRLFLGRMLDTERRAARLDAPVPLDNNFRLDCEWWHENINQWNGISILEFYPAGIVGVDASSAGIDGKPALGAFNFMSNQWFKVVVPESMEDWHISDLELLTHIVVARVWGAQWSGLCITGHTDSEAAQKFLSSGRSKKDRRLVMGRVFWALQHRLSFSWKAVHIPGTENILPDAASRWSSVTKQRLFWQHCSVLGINSPKESIIQPEHLIWNKL